MSKKFNVSFDEELFDRLEDFSNKKHVNRSAILAMAVQQYMDAQDKIPTLMTQLDELATLMPIFKGGIGEIKDAVEKVQAK